MRAKCKRIPHNPERFKGDFKLKVLFTDRDELEVMISLMDWGMRNACTLSEQLQAKRVLEALQEGYEQE